jgi:aldose 1-epimerase
MKSLFFFGTIAALYLCFGPILPTAIAQAGSGPVLKAGIEKAPFGTTKDGRPVEIYTLRNSHGLTAKVMTYGAIIVSLEVPDRDGEFANVNANRPSLAAYEAKSACFGSLIGRYANRIAKGKFILDGTTYSLGLSGGPNHIHGGFKGFDKRVWHAEPNQTADSVSLTLTYTSPDGEEGYPGTVNCKVVYELNDRNEWKMDYSAKTDKATPINLSNHSYWNLAGSQSGTILDQVLTINADRYLLVDDTLIPTGETAPVEGTPLDFRSPHTVGERIGQIKERQFGGGYDHCFVIKHEQSGDLALAARFKDPKSGRVMEVHTTEPGVQIYSANFGSGSLQGPNGYQYPRNLGLCLETQHYPDSANHPEFPSTILRPGQTYHSLTLHRFSVEK